MANGENAVSQVIQAADYGLHPLLFQQPDCGKSELYQGIPAQAADGALHPGRLDADGVYQEKDKKVI